MSFFRVDNLGIRFGGLVAVDNVSFEVRRGEVFTIIGPNGAGKTTIFNLIGLIYPPSTGRIVYEDRDLTGFAQHRVAERGIARTFQNIELFEHATVLQNLLIGRHRHRVTNLFEELVFLPGVRRAEIANDMVLYLARLTPMHEAEISESRIATKARPVGERSRLMQARQQSTVSTRQR